MENPAETPNQIWQQMVNHFRSIDPNFSGINKQQATTMVYNVCWAATGGDAIHKVQKQWSGSKKSATLQYSATFVDDKGEQKIMMFSDPELMKLLKYEKVSFLWIGYHLVTKKWT